MDRITKENLPTEVFDVLESLTLYEIVEKDRQSGRKVEDLILTTQGFKDMQIDLKIKANNLDTNSDRKYEHYVFALKEKLKGKKLIIID